MLSAWSQVTVKDLCDGQLGQLYLNIMHSLNITAFHQCYLIIVCIAHSICYIQSIASYIAINNVHSTISTYNIYKLSSSAGLEPTIRPVRFLPDHFLLDTHPLQLMLGIGIYNKIATSLERKFSFQYFICFVSLKMLISIGSQLGMSIWSAMY